jgi:iron(III) transport system substrate-binding protein
MMKKKNLFAAMFVGVLCIILATTVCFGDKDSDKGLTLTLYGGSMEDHMVATVDKFQKQTGIKVQAIRLSSGEIVGRVRAEKNNPKASIWFGGPADAFVQASNEGLLENYSSPEAANIPAKFKDKNGAWTGIYFSHLGFASNQKLLKEKKVKAPTSWNDLLKPKFKGQISMADPRTSGTAYTALATVTQIMGEAKGLKYMKALNKNIRSYEKSGSAPARMAGQGEVMVGIVYLNDALTFKKEGFSDLVMTSPKEGTGVQLGAVAILKGGPDQKAARIFIDWALGVEAQEIGRDLVACQPTNIKSKAERVDPAEKNAKAIDYDFNWAGKNREMLLKKWSDAIK